MHENLGLAGSLLADQFVSQIEDRMGSLGVSRAELARRLGCSRPNITRLLRMGGNPTIQSMAGLARALNCTFVPPVLVSMGLSK